MSHILDRLLDPRVIESLGWTIIHSLWQGVAIFLVAWMLLRGLRDASPEARYSICGGALGMTLLTGAATFAALLSGRETGAPLSGPVFAFGREPSPGATPSSLFVWLVLAWGLGVAWLLGRRFLEWRSLTRLIATARPVAASWRRRVVLPLAERFGVRRALSVLESTGLTVPATFGWLRPVLLIPIGMSTGLTPAQVELILAHELAHIRRRDYLVNLMQALIEALMFYHPAIWWLSHRMRIEREYCCDDLVVAARRDSVGYARALTELEARRRRALSLSLSAAGGSLMDRVRRLVRSPGSVSAPRRPGLLASASLLFGVVGALSLSAYGLAIEGEGQSAGKVAVGGGAGGRFVVASESDPACVNAIAASPLDGTQLALRQLGYVAAPPRDDLLTPNDDLLAPRAVRLIPKDDLLARKKEQLVKLAMEIAEMEQTQSADFTVTESPAANEYARVQTGYFLAKEGQTASAAEYVDARSAYFKASQAVAATDLADARSRYAKASQAVAATDYTSPRAADANTHVNDFTAAARYQPQETWDAPVHAVSGGGISTGRYIDSSLIQQKDLEIERLADEVDDLKRRLQALEKRLGSNGHQTR